MADDNNLNLGVDIKEDAIKAFDGIFEETPDKQVIPQGNTVEQQPAQTNEPVEEIIPDTRDGLIQKVESIIKDYYDYEMTEPTYVKDNFSESVLFTPDEIINEYLYGTPVDENTGLPRKTVLDYLEQLYTTKHFRLDEAIKEFDRSSFKSFVSDYFYKYIDLIVGTPEVRISEANDNRFLSYRQTLYFVNDITIVHEAGLTEVSDKIEMTPQDATRYNFLKDKFGKTFLTYEFFDANKSDCFVDFVYKTNDNILTFRIADCNIYVLYNNNIIRTFKYIAIDYNRTEVELGTFIHEDLDLFKKCALVTETLRTENIAYSPASNAYETFKMLGMTKYEQIGFFANSIGRIEFDSEDYPVISASLLNEMKDGIPESMIQALDLDPSNLIDSLTNLVDDYNLEAVLESITDEQKVYLYTAKLFVDIVNEKFEFGDYYNINYLDSVLSNRIYTYAVLYYAKAFNITDFNQLLTSISENCILFTKDNNAFKYGNAKMVYRILSDRIQQANYVLVANDIIREASYDKPEAQMDYGFTTTILPLKCPIVLNGLKTKLAGYDIKNTKLFIISTIINREIKNSENLSDIEKEVILSQNYLPSYYFLQYVYYSIVKDNESKANCPIRIEMLDDTNLKLIFDLGKVVCPISDEIIVTSIPKKFIEEFLSTFGTAYMIVNTDLNKKPIINFISNHDYLKLQYLKQQNVTNLEFFCLNAHVGYDRIVNRDARRALVSKPLHGSKWLGLSSAFYISGAEFKNRIMRYLVLDPKINYDQLSPLEQDDCDTIEDAVTGNLVPGCVSGCVPAEVMEIRNLRQIYATKKVMNHMENKFDLSNKAMFEFLEYNRPELKQLQKPEPDYNKEFNVQINHIYYKTNSVAYDINFDNVNVPEFIHYVETAKNTIWLEKDVVYVDDLAHSIFEPDFLEKYAFKVDKYKYILKVGSKFTFITLFEEVVV